MHSGARLSRESAALHDARAIQRRACFQSDRARARRAHTRHAHLQAAHFDRGRARVSIQPREDPGAHARLRESRDEIARAARVVRDDRLEGIRARVCAAESEALVARGLHIREHARAGEHAGAQIGQNAAGARVEVDVAIQRHIRAAGVVENGRGVLKSDRRARADVAGRSVRRQHAHIQRAAIHDGAAEVGIQAAERPRPIASLRHRHIRSRSTRRIRDHRLKIIRPRVRSAQREGLARRAVRRRTERAAVSDDTRAIVRKRAARTAWCERDLAIEGHIAAAGVAQARRVRR